jgi:hypothetical protein
MSQFQDLSESRYSSPIPPGTWIVTGFPNWSTTPGTISQTTSIPRKRITPEKNYDKKVENEDYKTLSQMRQSFVNIF